MAHESSNTERQLSSELTSPSPEFLLYNSNDSKLGSKISMDRLNCMPQSESGLYSVGGHKVSPPSYPDTLNR